MWHALGVHHVDIDGLRIGYRDRGSGPALVLLHGWPVDSREWSRQLDGLSDVLRVVAWDAPGAGQSSDPPDDVGFSYWADRLVDLLDRLGIDQAHVGGLSFGGALALELHRCHPDRVRSLVLLSAYAGWGGSLPPDEVQRRLDLIRRNTELPAHEWVPALIETLLPEGSDRGLHDELTIMLSDLHRPATRTALAALGATDLRDHLPEIAVPTLMIYGGRDVRSPREVWQPIHDAIRGSELVVIPDVGHMVDMQAPEAVNAAIRAFVDRVENAR